MNKALAERTTTSRPLSAPGAPQALQACRDPLVHLVFLAPPDIQADLAKTVTPVTEDILD